LGITSISPKTFEKQISYLKQGNYKGLSHQFLIGLKDNYEKNILITFDDGYEGVYNYVFPILKKYGFSAIIFLTTGYIGKYNNWDNSPGPRFRHLSWHQIIEMSNNGIEFASHGVNHFFLTNQSNKIVKYELETSKKNIEDKLGKPVCFFSYPYGNYSDNIINLVKEAGYDAAFSLNPIFLSKNNGNNLYELPRFAIYCIDTMSAFKTKIGDSSGDVSLYIQQLKNRFINRCSHAGMMVEKLKLPNKRI